MQARIENIAPKKLIGKRLRMSLVENKTAELWRSFIPHRKEITNNLNADLLSMQVFDEVYYYTDPNKEFEKWAVVEVADYETVPTGMETFDLPGGLYAVFLHKGAAATAAKTFGFIFRQWLPNSDYVLDNRPHFEVIGAKYKNDSPDSEEEIWIPVKRK